MDERVSERKTKIKIKAEKSVKRINDTILGVSTEPCPDESRGRGNFTYDENPKTNCNRKPMLMPDDNYFPCEVAEL